MSLQRLPNAMLVYWPYSTGRRNTYMMRCLVGVIQKQKRVQAYRGQIVSPGRPTVAWREDRVRFWAAIARGAKTSEAGVEAGVSEPVVHRWLRHAGGVNPQLIPTVSGRGWPRSETWREAVQVVAIDPSAAFRKALREHLPRAAVSVDAFHLVKLANDTLTQVRQRLLLAYYVDIAAMPETTRLLATVNTWWDAIEVLVVTGVTNARTEAANTTIKQLKRTGRGYRNPAHYRARILLASAARSAA